MHISKQDRAWTEFVAWCRRRRLKPLPAHPWTLAAYIRWCESQNRRPSLTDRLRAIARMHLLRGETPPDRHPTVKRTVRIVESRHESRAQRAALFSMPDEPKHRRSTKSAEGRPKPGQRHRPSRLRDRPRLVSRRPSAC